jgi:hypothetical protein
MADFLDPGLSSGDRFGSSEADDAFGAQFVFFLTGRVPTT